MVTPIIYGIKLVAFVMGIVLWIRVWEVVPLGQALFVLGLIVTSVV